MNIENWELEVDLGYTFEFCYKAKSSVTIKIIASSEKEAWKILYQLK
jgi:hypothetical protein